MVMGWKKIGLFALAAAVLVATFHTAFTTALFPSQQGVERALEALGYSHCGEYEALPGKGEITFSRMFNNEVRCYLIIKRPGPDYTFSRPHGYMLVEPPTSEVPYQYNFMMNNFAAVWRISAGRELFEPYSEWMVGVSNTTRAVPPPLIFKDDLYLVFSYKAGEEGYPVRITIKIYTNTTERKGPPIYSYEELFGRSPFTPPPPIRTKKLWQQLETKDIHTIMSHLGYRLCGEYHLKDEEGIRYLNATFEIDLNNGTACYILIYPPPGKGIHNISHGVGEVEIIGDEDQSWTFFGLPNPLLFTGPVAVPTSTILSEYGEDILEPYIEKTNSLLHGTGGGAGSEDGSPLLVYFAFKKNPEEFNDKLNFSVRVLFYMKYFIIPIKR